MQKKILAMILALSVCTGVFASCGKKDKDESSSENSASDSVATSAEDVLDTAPTDDETTSGEEDMYANLPVKSLTIDGKSIETDDLIMVTINGVDFDFDTFRYYLFMVESQFEVYYGVDQSYWEDEANFKNLLETVVDQMSYDAVTKSLSQQYSVELTDEDKEAMETGMQTAKEQYGENYEKQLQLEYLTDEVFEYALNCSYLQNRVSESLFAPGGEFASTEEDIAKMFEDGEYIHVKSILIPYECMTEIEDESSYEALSLNEKMNAKKAAFAELDEDAQNKLKEEAKAQAETVLAEAKKSGADFDALITQYGWDPGMESLSGYDITENTSFVEEYLEAAFKLGEDEVSDLVESTSYGYFIIKREAVDEDYIKENADTLISEVDENLMYDTYQEMMEDLTIEYGEYYDKLVWGSIT